MCGYIGYSFRQMLKHDFFSFVSKINFWKLFLGTLGDAPRATETTVIEVKERERERENGEKQSPLFLGDGTLSTREEGQL